MYREETHAPLNLPVTFQSLSPFLFFSSITLLPPPACTLLPESSREKKGPTRQARCQGNSIARQTNPINLFPTRFQDRGRWGRMVDGGDGGWIERVKEVFSVFPKALNVKRSLTFDRVSLVHGADILQRYPFLQKKQNKKRLSDWCSCRTSVEGGKLLDPSYFLFIYFFSVWTCLAKRIFCWRIKVLRCIATEHKAGARPPFVPRLSSTWPWMDSPVGYHRALAIQKTVGEK